MKLITTKIILEISFATLCIADNIPFSGISNNEMYSSFRGMTSTLNTSQNINTTQEKHFEKLNKLIENNTINLNSEEEEYINCKYYNVEEFHQTKLKAENSFSILHLNIHSIQLHIEELRTILLLLEFKFDIIAISESKLQLGIEPNVDLQISGYHTPLSTPTEDQQRRSTNLC